MYAYVCMCLNDDDVLNPLKHRKKEKLMLMDLFFCVHFGFFQQKFKRLLKKKN